MNNRIRLTESELHLIVNETIKTIIQEQIDEGVWNNLKTGAKHSLMIVIKGKVV